MSTWFQGLFDPPLGVLFPFPSRYLFAIGRLKYLALESGLPRFPQNCTCFVVLRIRADLSWLSSTGLSPPLVRLSSRFEFTTLLSCSSYNPKMSENILVWASPGSLATTTGISVDFFSSGY